MKTMTRLVVLVTTIGFNLAHAQNLELSARRA